MRMSAVARTPVRRARRYTGGRWLMALPSQKTNLGAARADLLRWARVIVGAVSYCTNFRKASATIDQIRSSPKKIREGPRDRWTLFDPRGTRPYTGQRFDRVSIHPHTSL